MNRGKDRNEGDKKGNSFVWGSDWRGGIIIQASLQTKSPKSIMFPFYACIVKCFYSVITYVTKLFFYIAYITHTYNIQLLSYFLF